jgi:hypothetical protein
MPLVKRMFERLKYFKTGGLGRGLFPVKSDWGTGVTSDLHLVQGLRMRGAIPPCAHALHSVLQYPVIT